MPLVLAVRRLDPVPNAPCGLLLPGASTVRSLLSKLSEPFDNVIDKG